MGRKRCNFVVCCNYSEVLFFLHLNLHTHPVRAVGRGGDWRCLSLGEENIIGRKCVSPLESQGHCIEKVA